VLVACCATIWVRSRGDLDENRRSRLVETVALQRWSKVLRSRAPGRPSRGSGRRFPTRFIRVAEFRLLGFLAPVIASSKL
jgi:hypothetical protein